MWVCTVVLNQAMDSLAVSAVGNSKLDSGAFINTDAIADYLLDLKSECSKYDFPDELVERVGKSRKEGDLEDLVQCAKSIGIATEIFWNKLGA